MDSRSRTSIWGQLASSKNFNKAIQEVATRGVHVKKDDYIKNMGEWENGSWRWRFRWRRNLFAWEEKAVGDLYVAVGLFTVRENTSDGRIWFFNKSNIFSVSSFVLQVNKLMGIKDVEAETGRHTWRTLAPPRAQLLCWFILQGRLNTKERLFRMGVKGVEDDLYSLCKEEIGSIEHIFFCCKVSNILWYFCCDLWNISFCLPKDPLACFLSWLGTSFRKCDKKIWISMFYIILWSIWDIRNKVIFQKYHPNWELEKRKLLGRIGYWVKGRYLRFSMPPSRMTNIL